jgi:hypothetical protein
MCGLTGCANPIKIFETKEPPVCSVWRDVSFSKKDTDQTITEIKVNNARREAWCKDR